MKLAQILTRYTPGSHDWPWQHEFLDLWDRDLDKTIDLIEDVRQNGITTPILLGDDGRVWDGHHRILAARVLKLDSLPVEHGWGSVEK